MRQVMKLKVNVLLCRGGMCVIVSTEILVAWPAYIKIDSLRIG